MDQATVMMKLGDYSFAVSRAAYSQLTHEAGFVWAEQPVVGGAPALQFTGSEAERLTLKGVIYPQFRGGIRQIYDMRVEAAKAAPLLLVSGLGDYLGSWVIERIVEDRTAFLGDGRPKKMEFTLTLKRYS